MSSVNNVLTLTIGSPSIVQQRIILLVFTMIISALVWWPTVYKFDPAVQKISKPTLPTVIAELDFASAEASWSGLRLDSHGNLKIDALTHTALAGAVALMQGQASELQMTRMALLLEKQFGATASQQIMELLPKLKNYNEVEQRWWQENGSTNPPAYADLFRLQGELLGESLAEKLFSEQRRLAKMMLASHRIQNDTSLTQAQKDQALTDLQKIFQEGPPDE